MNMDYVGWAAVFLSCVMTTMILPIAVGISHGFLMGLVAGAVFFGPGVMCGIQMIDAIGRI